MARDTFGKGIGEGKLEMIGDPRYGLIEEYDSAVSTKTKEYYRTLPEKTRTIKEVKNPNLQTVKTVKAKKQSIKLLIFAETLFV